MTPTPDALTSSETKIDPAADGWSPAAMPEPIDTTRSPLLEPTDTFIHRHIGPSDAEIGEMLSLLGHGSLEELSDAVVPEAIRLGRALDLGPARGEFELLEELRRIAAKNRVYRTFIGMGYHDTITPPVIQRNILENPGWYTQYTPYQSEISQGRLEALLNFQTMVADLTALPLAGASLLDEATAAAEGMAMCFAAAGGHEGSNRRRAFFVAEDCHPQTIAVCRTRAGSMGIELVVGNVKELEAELEGVGPIDGGRPFRPPVRAESPHPADSPRSSSKLCGVLVQYPTTDGRIECYEELARRAHAAGALVVAAADLLALTLIRPPGEWGADIAVGTTQRFGVAMGFGGPHAGYIACRAEHARRMPGRIIGVSKDSHGNMGYRMAIQTREQHIRRERATSNICTAQALLAIMAGMYAVYHGPEGLRAIARRVHALTRALRAGLLRLGHRIGDDLVFDTLRVRPEGRTAGVVLEAALARRMNLRDFGDGTLGITLDETTDRRAVADLLACFGGSGREDVDGLARAETVGFPGAFARTSPYLAHPVFNTHHSETELLRYIYRLQHRDLSLAHAMIPLGSCTMKLNATSEMLPVSWPEFSRMHPFAPADQAEGYAELFRTLEAWLAEITGFAAVSLQPNAGSQGEYAGLLAIRAYHESRGEGGRNICLIPVSAHGTNPASAVIAGMRVEGVECDARGDIRLDDLRAKAARHAPELAALMVTYPSTHGVFEEAIGEVCRIVHEHGGQVYMDGANMNAQVGLCRPGDIGADVCHLNLHKTFCIPHGGGGPGMGPICVAPHLAPFLPGHPLDPQDPSGVRRGRGVGPVSAAPWGSASILTISWVYIALMGAAGLTRASRVAILSANYIAARLGGHYGVVYTGGNGRVAHECILHCRGFEKSAGVRVEDIAKRLIDYGFHAPTMSWPVPGTLMVEPTESEPKAELDRFCDAMIAIREEIGEIERGEADRKDNVLRNAPHTVGAVSDDGWSHGYSRRKAAFPLAWVGEHKFWPAVGRIDNAYGDRNLACVCPPVDAYAG